MPFFLIILFLGIVSCHSSRQQRFAQEKKQTDTKPNQNEDVLYQPLTNRNDTNALNEYLYTFVGKFLEDDVEQNSEDEIKRMIERERKNQKNRNFKPLTAGMAQTEMSDVLSVMCLKNKRYRNITLYGKDGVGCATSVMESDSLVFPDRPNDLNLGFLTPEILSGKRIYHYMHRGTVYEERIYPVFKTGYGAYAIKKENGGLLIGYLSYLYVRSSPFKR